MPDSASFDGIVGVILARETARMPPGLAGGGPLAAAAVAVCRNNVRASYLRALEAAFPVVNRLVGAEFFRFAANEYFYAHPPRSPMVARYGDLFPAFLAEFEPAAGLAYLPDVARLEIEHLKSYHAAEADSLPPEETRLALECAPERALIALHPSARLFASRHSAFSIWAHNREAKTGSLKLRQEGEQVLVVRLERAVCFHPLAPAVFAVLESLSLGRPLGEALGRGLVANPRAASPAILFEIASLHVITNIDNIG